MISFKKVRLSSFSLRCFHTKNINNFKSNLKLNGFNRECLGHCDSEGDTAPPD